MSGMVERGQTVSHGNANPPAFWLSLAGLVMQALGALMVITMYPFFSNFGSMMGHYGGMMAGYYGGGPYGWTVLWLVVAGIPLILGILGVAWMNSPDARRTKNGSILVLVAAVIGFPLMWGLWFGSILMFVGAIIGLTTGPNRQ